MARAAFYVVRRDGACGMLVGTKYSSPPYPSESAACEAALAAAEEVARNNIAGAHILTQGPKDQWRVAWASGLPWRRENARPKATNEPGSPFSEPTGLVSDLARRANEGEPGERRGDDAVMVLPPVDRY